MAGKRGKHGPDVRRLCEFGSDAVGDGETRTSRHDVGARADDARCLGPSDVKVYGEPVEHAGAKQSRGVVDQSR